MVFSSLTFLFYFLPIALAIYYISPKQIRNFVIFISGLFFYAWGEPIYVVIMVLSTLIDYLCGLGMHRWEHSPKARRLLLIASVVMNLSLLSIFKYGSLFINTINGVLGTAIPDPKLPLPIGISFYTFQSMSYTIDLYRREIPVQKNFFSFGGYVTLFPQIVAGPIVRYADVQNEIDNRKITLSMVSDGIGIFIKGLAKKILIANNIGALWANIKAMPISELSAPMAWMGILAFTFQIFFDFSGYSDMAIGMGKMLGFNFPKNFDLPYTSKSISEFWRRWHMTLGSWFKSYVYFPLGGNRKGNKRTIINLLIVWSLTGFWHGASWNFVLWGFYFGVIIVCEKLFLGKLLHKLPAIIRVLYQFFLVVIGWVMFEYESITDVGRYLLAMFGGNGLPFIDDKFLYYLTSYIFVFVVCVLFSSSLPQKTMRSLYRKKRSAVLILTPIFQGVLFVICIAYLVDATFNPFLYFRF